jgi:hypothetical protein
MNSSEKRIQSNYCMVPTPKSTDTLAPADTLAPIDTNHLDNPAIDVYVKCGGICADKLSELSTEDQEYWISRFCGRVDMCRYIALARVLFCEEMCDLDQCAATAVRDMFAAINNTSFLLNGDGAMLVTRASLENPSKPLADILNIINKCSLRVFGDTHGGRRAKALVGKYTNARVVGTLNIALGYVGAVLEAVYANNRDKETRRNAIGYCPRFLYGSSANNEAYQKLPHPVHPQTNKPDGNYKQVPASENVDLCFGYLVDEAQALVQSGADNAKKSTDDICDSDLHEPIVV